MYDGIASKFIKVGGLKSTTDKIVVGNGIDG